MYNIMRTDFSTIVLRTVFFLTLSFVSVSQIYSQETEFIKPKNVILFIGDGMGHAQVQSALLAAEEPLHMQRSTNAAMVTTHSFDDLVTDSGAGGTAIATGQKTRNGMIGMNPDSIPIPSILDIFANEGRSTGLVVSCAVTHATPASFVAKAVSRHLYEDIAADFLTSKIDVAIGGGITHFNKRKDGRTLTDEMQAKGFSYLNELPETGKGFDKLLVLTDSVHPESVLNGRGNLLPNGTRIALEALSQNEKGFFLMVEGSQIDWGGHANDSAYVVSEMFDFDLAIKEAFDFADTHPETLVLITADHETGGLTIIHPSKNEPVAFNFSTKSHSGVGVPLFAYGAAAQKFGGIMDNTDIVPLILEVVGFKKQ